MRYLFPLRSIFLGLSWFSGLLLLASVVQRVYSQETGQEALVGPTGNNVLMALMMGGAVLYQKWRFTPLRLSDFVGYLSRLLLWGMVLALSCLVIFVGHLLLKRYYQFHSSYVTHLEYLLFLGAGTAFFVRMLFAWKRVMMASPRKRAGTEWKWFELLLLATLFSSMLGVEYLSFLFYPLVALLLLYAAYLSANLRWVAYLNVKHKVQTMGMLLGILACAGVFVLYFFDAHRQTGFLIQLSYTPFLMVVVCFVIGYGLLSILVVLFNIPTTKVFEQKRKDVVNFQHLSQSIQQGKDEDHVYQTLFDSALQTSDADAGWLELNREGETILLNHKEVSEDLRESIKDLLKHYHKTEAEFFRNELADDPAWTGKSTQFHSLATLPLRGPLVQYGTLYLLKEEPFGFDKDTLDLLQAFGSQTIITIENFHLLNESIENEQYRKELTLASKMQDSLLPKSLPSNIPLDISIHNQPAKEVGGDFYDFYEFGQDRLAILIGDVSGKGISAAFHMAQMKGVFQALMQLDLQPDQFMNHANAALSRSLDRSSFITASVYFIDYNMKGISFARAGHCHTLYHNCRTEETFYFKTEGLGLGIMRDARYAQRMRKQYYDYNEGDLMVLYTDGITEARNDAGDEFGTDRLLEIVSSCYDCDATVIKDKIINALNIFSPTKVLHDDQTLLVLKFK